MKKIIFVSFLMLLSKSVLASVYEVTAMPSKELFNQFVFEQPFSEASLSNSLVLESNGPDVEIKKLNQNRMLLMKFKPVKQKVQLFVVMKDGSSKQFVINIDPNAKKPLVWPSPQANNIKNDMLYKGREDQKEIVELLKIYFTSQDGNIDGFSSVDKGDAILSDPILIDPINAISNGQVRIVEYAISSKFPLKIKPEDFNSPNVLAIDLTVELLTARPESLVIVYTETK